MRLLLQATLLCWRSSSFQSCLWNLAATDYCQHWQKALAEDYIHRQKVWPLKLPGKHLHACLHNTLRFTAIPCTHKQHGTPLHWTHHTSSPSAKSSPPCRILLINSSPLFSKRIEVPYSSIKEVRLYSESSVCPSGGAVQSIASAPIRSGHITCVAAEVDG